MKPRSRNRDNAHDDELDLVDRSVAFTVTLNGQPLLKAGQAINGETDQHELVVTGDDQPSMQDSDLKYSG